MSEILPTAFWDHKDEYLWMCPACTYQQDSMGGLIGIGFLVAMDEETKGCVQCGRVWRFKSHATKVIKDDSPELHNAGVDLQDGGMVSLKADGTVRKGQNTTVSKKVNGGARAMHQMEADMVNHPNHYTFGKYEVLSVIEDWGLEYHEGNVVKYVARAKHKGNRLQDLKKAQFYLNRAIENLERDKDLAPTVTPDSLKGS